MFDRVIGLLDQFKPQLQWHGRRLFAIDGTKVQLPASEELRDHFNCPQNQGGKAHYPQGFLSILFCVLTDVVYNFELAPCNSDERKLALLHLDRLRPADIIIMDRGYPSYELKTCVKLDEFILTVQVSECALVRIQRCHDTDCSWVILELADFLFL
jgi:hypothetical protein